MEFTEESLRDFYSKGFLHCTRIIPIPFVQEAVKQINIEVGDGIPAELIGKMRVNAAIFGSGQLINGPAIQGLLHKTRAIELVHLLLDSSEILMPEYYTQIAIRFPQRDVDAKQLPWHLDNVVRQGINPFSLLVGVFLSETTAINSGNFTVFPGGHIKLQNHFRSNGVDTLYRNSYGRIITPEFDMGEEHQFITSPGDVVFCHHQLPHRASINLSPNIRYAVFFRFYNKNLPFEHPTQCCLRYYSLTNVFKVGWSHKLKEIGEEEYEAHGKVCRCGQGLPSIQDILSSAEIAVPFISHCKCSLSLRSWVEVRQFMAGIFHRDGTVFDIGCANGFLLACFKHWSKFTLIPYGIEKDSSVYKAEILFPDYFSKNHFVQIDIFDYAESPGTECPTLPPTFDFVYWNVWSNGFDLDNEKDFKFVEFCMKLVNPNGRLILGFYGTKEQSMSKIDILKRTLKIELDVLECPHGQHPHIAAWYTQPSDGS